MTMLAAQITPAVRDRRVVVFLFMLLSQRHGSPGAMPAPEFIMVLSAAPGTAYAVKPVVGRLPFFSSLQLLWL